MDGLDLAERDLLRFDRAGSRYPDAAGDLSAAAAAQGILGFPTQRGDRFFVSLIGAAFIFILWMRFDGGALWYPLGLSRLFGAAMFKFA